MDKVKLAATKKFSVLSKLRDEKIFSTVEELKIQLNEYLRIMREAASDFG